VIKNLLRFDAGVIIKLAIIATMLIDISNLLGD